MEFQPLECGGVTSPAGFRAAGVACGIKESGALDLALVVSERPCAAAAVFTTNRFKAAPVLYDQALLAKDQENVRAVVINSGCANACTGARGLQDTRWTSERIGELLGLPADSVWVMSTGVIGAHLDLDALGCGCEAVVPQLSSDGGHDAAVAIMTTDTRPKEVAITLTLAGQRITIGGMCKGAGMIHPNMATMLALLTTDAIVEPAALDRALRLAVDHSFHCVTVDGDTSTNDTVLLLANGAAGNDMLTQGSPEYERFTNALTWVADSLSQMIARDGEGATKLVTVALRGARTDAEAHTAAMAVARSSLVKTAIYGRDPNWGRILAAVGYSGIDVDPSRTDLWLSTGHQATAVQLVHDGNPCPYDEERAKSTLEGDEVLITVELGLGSGEATVYTCDLSHEYVTLNAEYRT